MTKDDKPEAVPVVSVRATQDQFDCASMHRSDGASPDNRGLRSPLCSGCAKSLRGARKRNPGMLTSYGDTEE
jgi:hypothetical protein